MLVKHNDKMVEVITIKELYEMAVAKGVENAAIGISFYDGETELEYCEETKFNDIEFGNLYEAGNREDNIVCPCIWINNHDF